MPAAWPEGCSATGMLCQKDARPGDLWKRVDQREGCLARTVLDWRDAQPGGCSGNGMLSWMDARPRGCSSRGLLDWRDAGDNGDGASPPSAAVTSPNSAFLPPACSGHAPPAHPGGKLRHEVLRQAADIPQFRAQHPPSAAVLHRASPSQAGRMRPPPP